MYTIFFLCWLLDESIRQSLSSLLGVKYLCQAYSAISFFLNGAQWSCFLLMEYDVNSVIFDHHTRKLCGMRSLPRDSMNEAGGNQTWTILIQGLIPSRTNPLLHSAAVIIEKNPVLVNTTCRNCCVVKVP